MVTSEWGIYMRFLVTRMKRVLSLLFFLLLLIGTQVPLTSVRSSQPPEARLAFFPPAPVIKAMSGDQYQFLSHVISLQCLFYFGTLVEERQQVKDWNRLERALYTSTRLDPYNMDAYYFAQAVLTWDARMPRQAIELLEYGFSHRTWDWYLPFFLSFDYAFFLKDYAKAAELMAKVAELKPNVVWLPTLAARYFYEGGETALALAYLKEMIATARNAAMKKHLEIRAEALEKILQIEKAILIYKERFHRGPEKLVDLVRVGIIERIPEDPYGGTFYLDKEGRVRTTSKLAFGGRSSGSGKN
jgi:tetratricopeptide (TPR) repeat protein